MKILEKRLSIVDQEIQSDQTKKPRFEDLLEKVGASGEAAKLYQPSKAEHEGAE